MVIMKGLVLNFQDFCKNTYLSLVVDDINFWLLVRSSGRHGFVVAVTAVETIGQGLIRDGTGFVTFPVKYQCVVFRPFKGEILESVVTMVNKVHIMSTFFLHIASHKCCISLWRMRLQLRIFTRS